MMQCNLKGLCWKHPTKAVLQTAFSFVAVWLKIRTKSGKPRVLFYILQWSTGLLIMWWILDILNVASTSPRLRGGIKQHDDQSSCKEKEDSLIASLGGDNKGLDKSLCESSALLYQRNRKVHEWNRDWWLDSFCPLSSGLQDDTSF